MSRHGWLAATGAALVLTACGCLSAPSRFHAERANVRGLTDLPPIPESVAAPGLEATRGQMPEDRGEARDLAQRYAEAGATWMMEATLPWKQSLDDFRRRITSGPPA